MRILFVFFLSSCYGDKNRRACPRLASLRLAMVTVHDCCGGSRLSQPEISRIQAEKLRRVAGGISVLFKSRRGNRFPPAVTEQIGRRPRNTIGRQERAGLVTVRASWRPRMNYLASEMPGKKRKKFLKTSQTSFWFLPSRIHIVFC